MAPTAAVIHGPAMAIETIIPKNPTPRIHNSESFAFSASPAKRSTPTANTTSDRTSGTSRALRSGPRRSRRRTPSGVIATRRRATTAAPTPTTCTSSRSPAAGSNGGTIESANQVAWPSGTMAMPGRRSRNRSTPPRAPGIVATSASTPASRVTWAGVAPASRMAASRCSRRAADSRVALATKTATGARAPMTAITTRIRISGLVGTGMSRVPSSSVVTRAPSRRRSSASRPTIAASSSGAMRPSSPIVPAIRPNRSPSWSGGVAAMSAASAGDT